VTLVFVSPWHPQQSQVLVVSPGGKRFACHALGGVVLVSGLHPRRLYLGFLL